MSGLVRRKPLEADPGFLVERCPLFSGKVVLHFSLFYKKIPTTTKQHKISGKKLVRRVGTSRRSATDGTLLTRNFLQIFCPASCCYAMPLAINDVIVNFGPSGFILSPEAFAILCIFFFFV